MHCFQNLEKNQELKSALLEETPWVLQAKDESQRKRMVGVLFESQPHGWRALIVPWIRSKKHRCRVVGFSWFPGFPEDRYMTQHIIAGFWSPGCNGGEDHFVPMQNLGNCHRRYIISWTAD